MLESRDPAASGAVRTALCLGLTLILLLSAAAVFLSGETGEISWFHAVLESVGLVEDGRAGAGAVAAPASQDGRGVPGGVPDVGTESSEAPSARGEAVVPGGEDLPFLSDETITIAQRAADPRMWQASGAPASASGAPPEARAPAGVLLDRGTGRTITGARILATAYRGTDDPWNAGYPPRYQDVAEIESDGSFQIPIFDPDDPRLLVYLQIDHPDYLPRTVVLERRDTVNAEWRRKEIRLRRGLTRGVQIVLGGGTPLRRAAVRVVPTRDGHALLERKDVWRAFRHSERLITRGEPYIAYTDDAGYLRLGYSENFYFLELLDPLYDLSHRDPYENIDRTGEILYHVPESGTDRLLALYVEPYALTLYDHDGEVIPDSEVEIEWGRGVVRTLSDEEGRVVVGLPRPLEFPRPPEDPPNARATVLTSAFFKRGVEFYLPNPPGKILIPSRPARRLEFRTTTHPVENEEDQPIAPDGVRVDRRGLTLVRRSASGEVAFQGAVPEAGEVVEINVRGYLPREVTVPPYTRETASVVLGDVAFERGLEKAIVLEGVERALLEDATLVVNPVDRPGEVQRYPLRGEDHLTVGGLALGVYDVGVEGSYLRSYSGSFEVAEVDLDEPVTIPLEQTDEENVVVRGRIVGLDPIQLARLGVIESYFIEGAREPIAMDAYPPAPDGTIGSVRRLRGVSAVRVAVVSFEEKAASLELSRKDGIAIFDAGDVQLFTRPHAEITFFEDHLGRLDPPLHVTLSRADGLAQSARFRVRHRRLFIDNLRLGRYQLSWAVGDGGKETIAFEVRAGQVTKVEVARALFTEEAVEVRIVDSAGEPIPAAELSSSSGRVPLRLGPLRLLDRSGLEPGVKLALVKTRETTRLQATLEGIYLPTRAEVEPGGVVPTELVLYRPASAQAAVLDADGIELDGVVRVSWEPTTASSITYGDPFDVDVPSGRFLGRFFPPLPMRFTFRLAGSETSITRVFTLPEDPDVHDLGVLQFQETRSLQGVVLLPDGSPAPGVTVALLEFDHAWRFPLRDPRDYDQVRYKAETDVQGGFTIKELPLELARDLVLVAHRAGFGDAYEYPLDREIETHQLQLDLAAGLELDVGYRDGLAREQFRFSLEFQADPTDPETRVELGEIPAQLFGLNTFSEIEPGLYRVKWGLRDAYDPIPPLYEEVIVEPGTVTGLTLLLEGRELRGKASLNGRLVTDGWILLSDAPGISASTRVGRIVDGRFLMIDPPRSARVYGAVIPVAKPQAIQNIARGEALPARIHGYTASLRNGFLSFDYRAYDLKLTFSGDFLSRYPGAYLTFPHYEWRDGRFATYRDGEPITAPFVRFHLLPPGIYNFTVRSERGALLLMRPISVPAPEDGVRMK